MEPSDTSAGQDRPVSPQDVNSQLLSSRQQTTTVLSPTTFEPFFTMIEDSKTGEFHHPNMLYIFSDDEPDELVAATLSALEMSTNESKVRSGNEITTNDGERILLLDMAADGKTVERAVSLSSQWQVLDARVGPAPSWAGANDEAHRGSMLTISGRRGTATDPDVATPHRVGEEYCEDLVRIFEQRLDELHAVLGQDNRFDHD